MSLGSAGESNLAEQRTKQGSSLYVFGQGSRGPGTFEQAEGGQKQLVKCEVLCFGGPAHIIIGCYGKRR